MDYSFLSLVTLLGLYTVLLYTRRSLEQHPSHSFILRLVISIVGWCLVITFAVYCVSIISLVAAFFSGNPDAGYLVVVQLILLTVLFRVYVYYEENIEVAEMKNFLRDALFFRNYSRRKDYELREEIDRHEMQRIYKEVTGKEPIADSTATAYDYHPSQRSKNSVSGQKISLQLHEHTIRELAARRETEVTEAFRLELMGNNTHPYIPLIANAVIDGKTSTLSLAIVLPVDQQLRWNEPNAKQRLIERMYEFLVILTSLPWFNMYLRYSNTVIARLIQTHLNDEAKEVQKEVLQFKILLSKMRARGTKITPASEIEKMATITFFD